jgi:putative ABC transporter-associated repeat protein
MDSVSHKARRPRLRAALRWVVGALTVAVLLPAVALGGTAHAEDDDSLTQRIDPDQAQGTGQVVRDAGHVDFGPTLNTGEWRIQIHDDTEVPKYWRFPSDVVLRVGDESIKQVPEGEEYAFLGQEPGSDVWIVPQVQAPDVIWVGWNTQEPTVLDSLSRGVTLSMLGVEGPGDVTVYLQSGNFGDVTVLWSSLRRFPQKSWIDVNTHTHANWVFSEPGVYLVEVRIDGQLLSGEQVSARDTLRFSVGDATDPQSAFGRSIDEELVAGESPDATPPAGEEGDGGLGTLVGIVVGAVVVVLVVAVVVVVVATRRAKARVRVARSRKGDGE